MAAINDEGKALCAYKYINPKFELFIGECKNHASKIGVTHIGKFCSLLMSNQVQLGIMFSYYGITGCKWNAASGLVKKFYLYKEKKKDRYCIIDFNINDFKRISTGDNFFQIVEEKLNSLQFDTDFTKHTKIKKHPAEVLALTMNQPN